MNEFELIEHFFQTQVQSKRPENRLGMGDDAAVIRIPEKHELVTSIDTLVAGVHFFPDANPYDVGYKAGAVSLSDMAAMGATPSSLLLSITLPEINQPWLQAFSSGLFALLDGHHADLIGGDTNRGPLSISTVANGIVPQGQALTRSGAKPGDLIYVSGFLGSAGGALALMQQGQTDISETLLSALQRPEPRVSLGLCLRNTATACIDISDGLAADLTKVIQASGVGATIYTEKLPIAKELSHYFKPTEAQTLSLTAGEDFELCFTIPANQQETFEQGVAGLPNPVHCIGEITTTEALLIVDECGNPVIIDALGFDHFKE